MVYNFLVLNVYPRVVWGSDYYWVYGAANSGVCHGCSSLRLVL